MHELWHAKYPDAHITKLEGLGICNNIRSFLKAAMTKGNTLLTINGVLGQVHIHRGTFRSPSPLLLVTSTIPLMMLMRGTSLGYKTTKSLTKISYLFYMDDLKLYAKSVAELESLVYVVQIFSKDISMDFGSDKYATLSVNRGKLCHSNGIELPNSDTMKGLGIEDSYKADDIKHAQIKNKITVKCLKRVRKDLKSMLNSGTTIKAFNK